MNLPKISNKIIFRYIFIIILASNIPIIFYLYQYGRDNVFNTVYFNEDLYFSTNQSRTKKLNISDFETVIKKLNQRENEKKNLEIGQNQDMDGYEFNNEINNEEDPLVGGGETEVIY